MYLGRRTVKARGYNSGFNQKDIDAPLDSVDLDHFVTELRAYNYQHADAIIRGHMGLALQIVGRYVNSVPSKAEDLVGIAMVAITDAVNNFPLKAVDNNITGYIVSNIHGYISNYIKEDTIIHVTRYHQGQLAGEYNETGEINLPQLACIDQLLMSTNTLDRANQQRLVSRCVTFEDTQGALELKEIIDKLNFTRFEMLVFEALMKGFNDTDIGKELGRSPARICQVKKEIREKLVEYYPEFKKE